MADATSVRHNLNYSEGQVLEYEAAEAIFAGELVSVAHTGANRNKAYKAGDDANRTFAGYALTSANVGQKVRVRREGVITVDTQVDMTTTVRGTALSAEDSQTVDTTTNATNNVAVGVLVEALSATSARVRISGI